MKKFNFLSLLLGGLVTFGLTACGTRPNSGSSQIGSTNASLPSDSTLSKYGLTNPAKPDGTLQEVEEIGGTLLMVYTGSNLSSFNSTVDHYYTVQGFNLNILGMAATKDSLIIDDTAQTGQMFFMGCKNMNNTLTDCVVSFFTKDYEEEGETVPANTLFISIGLESNGLGGDEDSNVPGSSIQTPQIGSSSEGTQVNADWFTSEELSSFKLNGLPSPAAGTYTKSYTNTEVNKMLYIGFKKGSENEFENYARALYDYGFKLDYDSMIDEYTPLQFSEALTDYGYKSFSAYKYQQGVCRLKAFGQQYSGTTSITILFEDLTIHPEKTWFTSAEASSMGLTGLNTFSGVSDKTVVVSNIEKPSSGVTTYKITVSDVEKNDALALCEYFYGKGANKDYWENVLRPSYDDSELMSLYETTINFRANFCNACSVEIMWYKDADDFYSEKLTGKNLYITLVWKTSHQVNNH